MKGNDKIIILSSMKSNLTDPGSPVWSGWVCKGDNKIKRPPVLLAGPGVFIFLKQDGGIIYRGFA